MAVGAGAVPRLRINPDDVSTGSAAAREGAPWPVAAVFLPAVDASFGKSSPVLERTLVL
jgi:hypothetical protein